MCKQPIISEADITWQLDRMDSINGIEPTRADALALLQIVDQEND